MPKRHPAFISLLILIVVTLSVAVVADAQEQLRPTCPSIVQDALRDLGTNCATLDRNTSCYGHAEVQHTAFIPSFPSDFYTTPGDRSDLYDTETIQTGPFNLAQELWGVNVMNVDANLPSGFSPKGVVYIQMGGVEIENGVEPVAAVTLVDGITVATSGDTDLLSWPPPSIEGHASEFVAAVPAGTSLSADAVDPTGNFARVIFQDRVGWVSLNTLNTSGIDLGGLPEIGASDFTPMQHFYYRTGIGGLNCDEAPSLIFVQGPNTTPVDIMIHDTPIRIESSVVMRSLPPGDQLGDQLELFTVSGLLKINPDTPEEIIVPPGFFSTVPLCPEFESLGIEGDADEKAACGPWSLPRPLTLDELDVCQAVAGLPDNLLYYPVGCPEPIEPSGAGQAVAQLFFPDPAALNRARQACEEGNLPAEICEYLGIQ